MFPAAPRYYTQYGGKRCALPLLADDYGLYYNKTLFKKAGITQPPRTISELTADAKKLTVRNTDGSIKVVGIDPIIGFYENVPERWVTSFGGQWTRHERALDPREGPGAGRSGPSGRRAWSTGTGTRTWSGSRPVSVTSSPPRRPSRRASSR